MKDSKIARKPLLTALAVLAALAVGIAVGARLFPGDGHLPPDRAPEQDPNAVPYEETLSGGEGGSVTLRYQAAAEIDRESGTAAIAFMDPASSDQGLVIQLLLQGEVLAESGLLPPGTAVYTLELLSGAAERLEPGDYDGSFLVSYYDTESGQRSVIQTEAEIRISVK